MLGNGMYVLRDQGEMEISSKSKVTEFAERKVRASVGAGNEISLFHHKGKNRSYVANYVMRKSETPPRNSSRR